MNPCYSRDWLACFGGKLDLDGLERRCAKPCIRSAIVYRTSAIRGDTVYTIHQIGETPIIRTVHATSIGLECQFCVY